MKRPPWLRRTLAGTVTCALVGGLAIGLPAIAAAAANSTVLFDQTFKNNTASGTGAVVKPDPSGTGQPNVACLTAAGGTTGVLQSCSGTEDPNGAGALSLTPAQFNQVGGVFAATSVPTAQGLDVQFTLHQWSANNGDPADGIAFALSAVDPTNPTSPPNIGPKGGALGYSAASGAEGDDGLAHGYLGIGFDTYGNYSNTVYQGTNCPTGQYSRPGLTPDQVVVRGPGEQQAGYCAINSTATAYDSPAVPLHGDTRAGSAVPVQIVINSSPTAALTRNDLSVPANSYLVRWTPVGSSDPRELSGPLPAMDSSYVDSPTWLDETGLPRQLAFGWVGSTGSLVDNHEITNVTVNSLVGEVPVLNVSTNSFTPGPNLVPGDPVGYVVTPGVDPGASDPGPITVSVTTPNGVKPLGGSGNGWVCEPPAAQQITCTNNNGPFPGGAPLPPVTVTGSATGNVTAEDVQKTTVTTASSDGSQPGYSDQAPPGTNPATPSNLSITPGLGDKVGGYPVTISGSNLGGATAVLVGTQDELTAGAGQIVHPCSDSPVQPCFTVSGGSLVVDQWPAHAVGPVKVQVNALGTAGTPLDFYYYEYTDGSLAITELRFSGPAGDGDDYVELTNTTNGPLPLAGVEVQAQAGGVTTIPAGTVALPSGGSYLIAGPNYSLGDLVPADQTATNGLGDRGIAVVVPQIGALPKAVDAVGNGESGFAFHEGTPLPGPSGSPTDQYGWVRTQQTGTFKQTRDNAADFALVSTDGAVVGGVQSMLGSPSPTSRTTPWNRSSTITSTLIDPTKSANVAPNRVVTKTPGTPGGRIESRRIVTNNTGKTITALQLRLIDITEANGLTPLASVIPPGRPLALLKAVPPAQPAVTVNGRTVYNVSPAAPSITANGGGLNSTFTVPLDGGLPPGSSTTVALTFDASTSGSFFFRYTTEALLAN